MTDARSLDDRRKQLLAQMLQQRGIDIDQMTAPPTQPTGAAEPGEPRPLSSAQARVWFQQQLSPDSAVYNLTVGLRVAAELDAGRLQAAVDRLVARTTILHTIYAAGPEGPVQIEHPELRVTVTNEALSDPSDSSIAVAARRLARRPFDLATECPLRIHTFTLSDQSFALVAVIHHIAADDASLAVLLEALLAGYTGIEQPETTTGDAPSVVRYSDHALWETAALEGGRAETLIGYWRSILEPQPPPISLPYDRRPLDELGEDGGTVRGSIAPDRQNALIDLGRSEGGTPFMSALAALAVLLHRVTAETDLPIGMPAVFRDDPGVANQIGNFQNTLVVRPQIHGEESFRQVLAAIVSQCRAAYAHQDLPFEQLVAELAPSRIAGRTPYIDVLLIEQRDLVGSINSGPLDIGQVVLHNDTSQFPLTLSVSPRADRLDLLALYRADLFDEATVTSLLDLYDRVVGAVVREPDRPVADLDLMPIDGNPSSSAPSSPATQFPPSTLVERFLAWADKTPDAVALRHRGEQLTYRELLELANGVAAQVIGYGAGPGDHVLVVAPPGFAAVAGIIGITLAGAAYVPVDVGNPPARIDMIASDANPICAVVTIETPATLRPTRLPVVTVGSGAADPSRPTASPGPDDPAYLIYTSGSTGTPKGVVVSHRSATRLFDATADQCPCGPEDRWSLCHSLGFDFSVWELWGPLLSGGSIVIVDPDVVRDPALLLEAVVNEQVTVLSQTPSAFAALATAADRDRPRLSLRWIVLGGEALDPISLDRWFKVYGDKQPRVVNMYGITETTVHVTARPMQAVDTSIAGSPIGDPLDDLTVVLLDRAGNPVPHGVAGEIFVGGAGVANGYHRRPDLTRERFVALPWSNVVGGSSHRWYRSGDLARRRADGELLYLGRVDDQHQVRGFRVELGEVESVLRRATGVGQVAVVVTGDQLAAYLVAEPAATIDPETIRDHARRYLPGHMVPGPIVLTDALPRTVNGKLDRVSLAARPINASSDAPREPMTGTAALVADIWAELLPDGTDIDPNVGFFDLGGHSLLLTRVRDELAARTGRPLPIAELYAHPTPNSLARFLDGSADHLAPGAPTEGNGSVPMPDGAGRAGRRATQQRDALARLRRSATNPAPRPTPEVAQPEGEHHV